jgi:flagellar basal-body rod modification protein FlgD
MISDSFASTINQASTPTPATRAISADFNTFLRMLTVQLENQDPLNPVDSADYAVQLATFSGVEQQVLTNDLLKSLAGQIGLSGLAEMASWVGKEARVAGPAHFDGSPLTLTPYPAAQAERAEIVVRNADGIEVQRFDIPVSAEPIEWAGVGTLGAPLPAGRYSFDVVSYKDDEAILTEPAEVYAEITEVQVVDGQQMLILSGGVAVARGAVTGLRGG